MATTETKELAYIGFKPCGCPIAFMVAGGSLRSERAELRRWVRQGYEIKVMEWAVAEKLPNFMNCPHVRSDHEPTELDGLDGLIAAARPTENHKAEATWNQRKR